MRLGIILKKLNYSNSIKLKTNFVFFLYPGVIAFLKLNNTMSAERSVHLVHERREKW